MESSIDRLDKYLKSKEINDNQFTVKTKIAQGWIGKARERKSSITEKTYFKIFKGFPDLNESWLKSGQGPMLKNSAQRLDSIHSDVNNVIEEVEYLRKENQDLKKELSELKDKLINLLLNPKK
jgi:hypothetical protein